MRMNPRVLALSLMVTAGLAAPALAQSMDEPDTGASVNQQQTLNQNRAQLIGANVDAFRTTVPALTYSVQDDRHAAVCYLDDAVGLLDLSRQQLRAGNQAMARVALLGASGKLTTAYLLNFRDRAFAQRLEPLTMQVGAALNGNVDIGTVDLNALRGQVASIGQEQLAMLPSTATGGGGGGGGTGGFEPINFLAGTAPEDNTTQDLNQLNVPTENEMP